LSGLQALDQTINNIKTKALESIRYMLEYIFESMQVEAQTRIPYISRV